MNEKEATERWNWQKVMDEKRKMDPACRFGTEYAAEGMK